MTNLHKLLSIKFRNKICQNHFHFFFFLSSVWSAGGDSFLPYYYYYNDKDLSAVIVRHIFTLFFVIFNIQRKLRKEEEKVEKCLQFQQRQKSKGEKKCLWLNVHQKLLNIIYY